MEKKKVKYVSTWYEGKERRRQEKEMELLPDGGEENCLLNLYPSVTYQTFEGFGGALTESAGYIYGQMNGEQKEEMLREYFAADRMGYRMVRIPIDSCDFSLGHYEAVESAQDSGFSGFQLERVEKSILPLLDDAQKAYGDSVEIMLTPWSPPAYMKSNGDRNNGGELKRSIKRHGRTISAAISGNTGTVDILSGALACRMSRRRFRHGIPVCIRQARRKSFCGIICGRRCRRINLPI